MPEINGRLTCCQCGADLGDASDPYRDPDCAACLRAELDAENDRDEAEEFSREVEESAQDRQNVAVTMQRDTIRDRQ